MSNYSRNRGQKVVKSGDYATMIAGLDRLKAAGYTNVVGELHTGGLVTSTSLIGRYVWDATAGVYQPDGEVRIDRVTDSRVAVIGAGVTGSELHTDSNAAAPQGETEADSVGNWTEHGTSGTGTSGSEAGGAPGSGSYNLFCQAGTGGTNFHLQYDFTVENATDYLVSFWVKATQPDNQSVVITGATGFSELFVIHTDWHYYMARVTTTGTSLILEFHASDTGPTSGDTIHFDGVSVLKIDDASTKIACAADHNVVATDTLTIWDCSAAAVDETGVTVSSVDGRFLNLDSALAETPQADRDYAHAEGTCEYGELVAGGEWVPDAGAQAWWDSGLKMHRNVVLDATAAVLVRCTCFGSPGTDANPFMVRLYASWALENHDAGNTSFFGVGVYSALYFGTVSFLLTAGAWARRNVDDDIATPGATGVGIASGTPDNWNDLETVYKTVVDTSGNVLVSGQTIGTGVTVGAVTGGVATAASQGQGANGPLLGVCLARRVNTIGHGEMTLKRLRVHWGE